MTTKTGFTSVDEYIATLPEDVQAILQRVRSTIRKAVPNAEEVISYQIPAYKLPGGPPMLWFAGWKGHYSLYPINGNICDVLKDDLAPYKVNNKGTLRLPLSQPIPEKLIARIAKFRAKEAGKRGKAVDRGGKKA